MKKSRMMLCRNRCSWEKTLRIMKISLVLLVFCGLTLSASPTKGQNQSVTLEVENATILDIFRQIEEVSNLGFFFKNDQLNLQERYSVNVENESIEEVLDKLLSENGYDYQIVGENVVVTRRYSENSLVQQQSTVSGTVTDDSGDPIPGVTVMIQGTTTGTITDVDGHYELNNVPENATLVFSFVGMKSREVFVESGVINVQLEEAVIGLDEIVAIGYGSMKKADVTSSVSSIKADDFIKGSVKDPGQLIQGKVAGLTIVNPSGDPTSNSEIILRGNTTLVGSSISPLVLIDGVPGDMNTVAPQDIESIDVLKDGSAAAIYGTRGTNGVILITTRRASGHFESSVEVSSYANVQTLSRKPNLSTAADFRNQIDGGFRDDNTDLGHSTDWLDEITRSPLSHVHNVTFRGGDEETNYLLNVNYDSAKGIFLNSFNNDFKGRADINHNMFDNKLKLNMSILGSDRKLNGFNGYNYRQSLIQNPTAPVKDENGEWFQQLTKFEYENPVSNLMESNGLTREHLTRFNSNIVFNPIKQLKLSSVLSYSKWNQNGGYSESKQHVSTLRDSRNAYASIGASESIDKLAEMIAEYSDVIGNHRFTALAGYSYQENIYTTQSMENWDFPTDQFGYYNIGLGEATKNGDVPNPQSSYHSETNLIGFFGRVSYSYADRYLFMGSLRREGASQLWGTDSAWGTFPAVSFGWRLTEEPFMAGQDIFDDIKFRVGYGVTGTQPSDLFMGVALMGYDQYVLSDGQWIKTLIPSQNANPDLKWEEKHEMNYGVDFTILNGRMSGSIDHYIRKIDGLLFDYAVPSPPNLYPTTRANVGEMENKGLEILLSGVPIQTDDFEWTTSVTFSTNSNKLISLSNDIYQTSSDYFTTGYTGPPVQTFTHIVKVGEPIGNFYGFKVIGVGNNPDDAANYGQWIYEGQDGESVNYSDFGHSFDDKKVIGNGLPNYYAGWTNNFRYKNWDLSISQRGAFDFQVANMQRMMYENPTYTQYNLLQNAFDPVFGATQLKSPHEFNSYYIEDGDYWKIDNITLGYNINNTGVDFLKSARVYVSSSNTLTITGYDGIDPEVSLVTEGGNSQGGININSGAGLSPGIDSRDKYPTVRIFTFGVNLKF